MYLPATNVDESCACCHAERPAWVHPLDPDRVRFRRHGKGHTLPHYWTVCADCEPHVAAGDEAELVRRMNVEWDDPEENALDVLVFRFADLGPRPLPDA